MTEWNAGEYVRVSGLQRAMAKEVLAQLSLRDGESVLDVGCGNGRITAELAARVHGGRVVGVDASEHMIEFARAQFAGVPGRDLSRLNLSFEVADARSLPFRDEFDLVVSFNALHWIAEAEQGRALGGVRAAMKPEGEAHLRLVCKGERKSLEDVIEETRHSPRWAGYFKGFGDPYLHLSPQAYVTIAERNGLRVTSVRAVDHAWDFESRAEFAAFGTVTFVAWTERIPDGERPAFVEDVLERYRAVACHAPGEEHVFRFYQMDVAAVRG